MWLGTRGLTARVQVPLLVSRRPTVMPQATSLSSKRQQHLLPQLMDQMMRLVTVRIPRITRILTPKRLNLLTRKMRDYTSLVTSRKLYQMILLCKLEWLVLYESKRQTPRGVLPAVGQATSQGIIRNGKKKMGSGPSSQRGLLKTSRPQRRPSKNPLSQVSQGLLQSRQGTLLEPRCFF